MNLLTDAWIPIQQSGVPEKITLQQLLCGDKTGEFCLPRDDMELACLQLMVAITQVLFMPENKKELINYIKNPISENQYINARKNKMDWFDLNHPETPFMQFRGVAPSKSDPYTGLDKLLAGVADGANKTFVNPNGLADELCNGCASIALFNMANNAPSVGGGFQGSFRGNTPLTVMVCGNNLRESIWLNVLNKEYIAEIMPWHEHTQNQKPNYIDVAKANSIIQASEIGFIRGLLWQPAHYELYLSNQGSCRCCGKKGDVYSYFKKEKFKYTLKGFWPHPLSAVKFKIDQNKNRADIKFVSFTTAAPAWTHLTSLVFSIEEQREGRNAAPVIEQLKTIMFKNRINLFLGGYRYKLPQTATIIERRHEFFSLSEGWDGGYESIKQIVSSGVEYKEALRVSLYKFVSKAIKSAYSKNSRDKISEICAQAVAVYYQQTESLIHKTLATINFDQPDPDIRQMNMHLKQIVLEIFNQFVEPYQHEPKMLKALALSRRSLQKSLKDLEPEQQTVPEPQIQEESHATERVEAT